MGSNLKTEEEIKIMAEAGRRLAHVLQVLKEETSPGITTAYLDQLAFRLIGQADAKPAFLGYKPEGASRAYPYTLCASINEVVVHGQPSDYIIQDGDLVKLDLGLKFKGFYVDSAVTVGVGRIGREAKKLIEATEESLGLAIEEAHIGNTIGDIGHTVEKYITGKKFSVVRSLTGHGIGRHLHEDPQVLNFGKPGGGEDIEVGMVLAIEPMVTMGSGRTDTLPDDSFITADGSLAAHFEHTVAITEDGPIVLTRL
ncbi:MAG: type I methionyl aminopeptidase [Patescibacteria group bacterium]|nr:type I methionyl aminopeptidase [Patescibacteria group bacterium]MDE2015576.1 type I methionyl aminopeptidase [Patescibacteria group bacterium]MDE2227228.1 type I methionyl aminopeptidase [Patescibacteria group bacterium]